MTTTDATLRRLLAASLLAASVLVSAAPAVAQDHSATGPAPAPIPGGPGNAGAGEAEARAQIALLLSGYHGLPPKDAFEGIAGVKAHLHGFARDTTDAGPRRDRALAALAYFADDAVFELYAQVLGDEATRDGTRHRVIRLAATTFGDRALPLLQPYLAAEDLQLRLTAVAALADIGSEAARAALRTRAEVEAHPLVKKRIGRATRRLR